MNQKKKQILSAVLCAAIFLSMITSCSDNNSENGENDSPVSNNVQAPSDTSKDDGSSEAETDEVRIYPDLPEVSYGGYTFRMLGKGQSMVHWQSKDLTAEEMHEYFRAEGIKSMLYYPLTSKGEFQGAIVFENHEDVQMELSKSEMEEIRSLFRLMEAHILQIGLMDRLQNFVAQVAVFDNMDSFVYVVNPDNHEISFINKKVLVESPDVKIGDTCYRALQNRDTPCENCILQNLDKSDSHCRCTEEIFNYSLRSWTRSSASWLECREENGLALINSFDISEYFMG